MDWLLIVADICYPLSVITVKIPHQCITNLDNGQVDAALGVDQRDGGEADGQEPWNWRKD